MATATLQAGVSLWASLTKEQVPRGRLRVTPGCRRPSRRPARLPALGSTSAGSRLHGSLRTRKAESRPVRFQRLLPLLHRHRPPRRPGTDHAASAHSRSPPLVPPGCPCPLSVSKDQQLRTAVKGAFPARTLQPGSRAASCPAFQLAFLSAFRPLPSADLHVYTAASKRFFKGKVNVKRDGEGAPCPQSRGTRGACATRCRWGHAPPAEAAPTSGVPKPSGAEPGPLTHKLRAECPCTVSDCGGHTQKHKNSEGWRSRKLQEKESQANRRKRLRNSGVRTDGRPRPRPSRKRHGEQLLCDSGGSVLRETKAWGGRWPVAAGDPAESRPKSWRRHLPNERVTTNAAPLKSHVTTENDGPGQPQHRGARPGRQGCLLPRSNSRHVNGSSHHASPRSCAGRRAPDVLSPRPLV